MARIEYFRKKKTIRTGWIVTGLILASLMIISSILLILYPFASKEKIEYFIGKNPILFQNTQHGNAIIEGDNIFIPFNFIKDNLDDSLIFDEKSNSIIMTTKNKVIQMPTESLTYYVNEKPVKLQFPAIQSENGELFLALEPLLNYYPIQYQKLNESNGIWILKDSEVLIHGSVKESDVHEELFRLRKNPTLKSPYSTNVQIKENVYIEDEKNDFYYIRKENGIAGYIEKKLVQKGAREEIIVKNDEKITNIAKINGPIRLTWEAVYKKNPNTNQLPKMQGLNVVSPTWFELENETGNIQNLGSLDYVKWAHKNGYQVWGLFSNGFDPKLTHQTFKDYETRGRIIRQLLHYSQMYDLDGINVDIENVNVEDGPLVTQFVREATPLFHEAGLTVSMDITFISSSGNWSQFYEREKLSKIVDYLIVMAYDEHWGSSPVAGSVSSLPWVEKNIEELLTVVPNHKLILGVPLYTRLWKEQILSDGSIEVSSKALSMSKIKKWLADNQLKPRYDAETGQNYAELFVKKENATYKVWLEDELSLKKRADLALKYQLTGVASWSRYFADDSAWAALHSSEKHYTDAINK